MNLDAIASYLQAQGLGTQGKDIFFPEMPTDCPRGILLMPAYHGTPINHYMPNYRATGFRLVTRGKDYGEVMALAKQAGRALTIHAETQLAGMLLKQCLPLVEPHPYRRGAGAYWETETEFSVNYVDTSG